MVNKIHHYYCLLKNSEFSLKMGDQLYMLNFLGGDLLRSAKLKVRFIFLITYRGKPLILVNQLNPTALYLDHFIV